MGHPVLRYAALTRRAPGKRRNEDALLVDRALRVAWRGGGTLSLDRPRVLAVADGVGGSPCGHRASRTLLGLARGRLREPDPTALAHALEEMQAQYSRGIDNPSCRGMATTLVGAVVTAGRACIFNVGDSRAYWLAGGQATQLSRDHSLLQKLLDAGQAQHALLARPDIGAIANTIYSAFVARPGECLPAIQLVPLPAAPAGALLLCSDGLSSVVGDDDLATLANGEDPAADVERLYRRARECGFYDDLTFIVASWPEPPEDAGRTWGDKDLEAL
ncbi:MAG: serine/threonine-protein phosphatase [Betaproteobacteria bacterium]|nr:serine/threonine-protein phosphatase [Betaproteobacteria bacterium]